MSHLRFGPEYIKSEYEIKTNADYIACGNTSYIDKFNILKPIKEKGTFLLNAPWTTLEQLEKHLPGRMKRQIASGELDFYVINATKLARDVGLGQRINMVMQAGFYHLSGVLPSEAALNLLKTDIENLYGKKGEAVVQMNKDCVDSTVESLQKIDYPLEWKESEYFAHLPTGTERVDKYRDHRREQMPDFVKNIMDPVLALEGDDLPVSAFTPGGYMPAGTTNFEKRAIAPEVPVWKKENCTQCGICVMACPHAVIRQFLFTGDEIAHAPEGFEALKATGGAEYAGMQYSINLATMDCTGCEVCVESCPDDALFMADALIAADPEIPLYEFAMSVPNKGHKIDKFSVKGAQFQEPLMEFSGACAGCGETPYISLLTRLFGERMIIANASGCSSVWGGTATTNPYTTNEEGRGPAWGRSLFEDNAEYGFGMAIATAGRRRKLVSLVDDVLSNHAAEGIELSPELKRGMTQWMKAKDDGEKCERFAKAIQTELGDEATRNAHPKLQRMWDSRDMLPKVSQWILGGDGWAYDIGFGGVDHVLGKGLFLPSLLFLPYFLTYNLYLWYFLTYLLTYFTLLYLLRS